MRVAFQHIRHQLGLDLFRVAAAGDHLPPTASADANHVSRRKAGPIHGPSANDHTRSRGFLSAGSPPLSPACYGTGSNTQTATQTKTRAGRLREALATRVIIAVHHPSDVIAGALVGVVGALIIRRWFAAQRLVFRPSDLQPYAQVTGATAVADLRLADLTATP